MTDVKKVIFVFGTRPEAIKMAPLIKLMADQSRYDVLVCLTGQHREMLDQVMELFDISADFNLDVMQKNQTLTSLTTAVLLGLDKVYEDVKPDLVLVHGDTTTTLAASLSAYYKKIPIAHVEAGLRTGDIYSPWPEEANRKVTSVLAALHFAPTETARMNLLSEGVKASQIYVTGNTVIDALHSVSRKIQDDDELQHAMREAFPFLLPGRKLVLVTGHRRESFGQGFENICHAIKKIATEFDDVDVVYPVHLNPQVREPVTRLLAEIPNVYLIEPQDYLCFVYLMTQSYLILTDSGGVQEEAPSLGKPVLVMRETTERPEAIPMGLIQLVGTDPKLIIDGARRIIRADAPQSEDLVLSNPFGDGGASHRIIDALDNYFSQGKTE